MLGSRWDVRRRHYLPWNLEFCVDVLGRKETENIFLERCLEILIENDVFPIRFLNLRPQPWVLVPESLVKHPYFVVQSLGPASRSNEQVLAGLLGRALVNEELIRDLTQSTQELWNLFSYRSGLKAARTYSNDEEFEVVFLEEICSVFGHRRTCFIPPRQPGSIRTTLIRRGCRVYPPCGRTGQICSRRPLSQVSGIEHRHLGNPRCWYYRFAKRPLCGQGRAFVTGWSCGMSN